MALDKNGLERKIKGALLDLVEAGTKDGNTHEENVAELARSITNAIHTYIKGADVYTQVTSISDGLLVAGPIIMGVPIAPVAGVIWGKGKGNIY